MPFKFKEIPKKEDIDKKNDKKYIRNNSQYNLNDDNDKDTEKSIDSIKLDEDHQDGITEIDLRT